MKKKRFVLIDANSLVHRAYHAYPSHLSTSDGEQTNAVYGFSVILLKVIEDLNPDYLICSFDVPKRTIRHDTYEEYKAHRKPKEKELLKQFPRVKEVVKAFNIPVLECAGYEADDVIGTVEYDKRVKSFEKIIVTGDQDIFQLVDKDTKVFLSGRNFRDSKLYGVKDVHKKIGLMPDQVVDFKAIAGDQSDNIPGIAGIGKVGALQLILKYKNIKNIYDHIDQIETRYKDKLREGKKNAFMSKKLAQIIKNVPIKWNLKDCIWGDYHIKDVIELFTKLEFRSLVRKVDAMQPTQEALFFTPSVKETAKKTSLIIEKEKDFSDLLSTLEKQKTFAVHVHCTSKHPLSCSIGILALCWEEEGYSIPIDLIIKNGRLTEDGKHLKDIFENEKIKKVGYDLKHVIHATCNIGIKIKGISFDTMLGAYILLAGSGKVNLEEIIFRYLHISIPSKREIGDFNLPNYIATETMYIWKIYKLLKKKLTSRTKKGWNIQQLFIEVEMPLIPILARMEKRGVLIDASYLETFTKELDEKISNEEQLAYKSVGHEFNIASPKQVSELLFEELDLPKAYKTKSGSFSTRDDILEQLAGVHPVINHIRKYREYSKLRSTYTVALLDAIDKHTGRIHTTFNQAITATGRLSSSNPNLQNIPVSTELGKKIRRAFIADKKHTLISFDYSQQELRLLAHFTGEKNLINAFKKGTDVHTLTASKIFNKSIRSISKKERAIGKTINFGIMYGMSGVGLSDFLKVPRREAISFIERYFEEYSSVKDYFDTYLKSVEKNGYAVTLCGRRRVAPQLKSTKYQVRRAAVRELINFPIQGSAADITKLAMIKTDELISKYFLGKAYLIIQVHDELVFEVKLTNKEKKVFIQRIKKVMEEVYPLKVPTRVDVFEGKNWKDLK